MLIIAKICWNEWKYYFGGVRVYEWFYEEFPKKCSKYVEITFVNDFKEDFKTCSIYIYIYIDISIAAWKSGIECTEE